MKAVRALNVAAKPQAAVAEVEKPGRKLPGDVLVRVLAVGIDGTDRDILSGGYGEPPEGENDLTIGHESLGVVEEAEEETGFSVGDLVTALVRRPCSNEECVNCRNGRADFCQTGEYAERGIKRRNGYMSEYYVEHRDYLVKIPVSCLEYGMLAEPQSIVEKVWEQAQRVQQRLIWEPKTALILGSGPLGLLAAMTCRCFGLETYVWSKSPSSGRQADLVRACGTQYIEVGKASPDGGAETLTAFAKKLDRPIDIIFECTGFSPLAFEAMTALGPNGVLALLSVTPGKRTIELPADSVNQQLVLENKCVLGSVNASRKNFETGIYRLQQMEEKFPGSLRTFITERLTMDQVPGLDYEKISMKAVVDIVPRDKWKELIGKESEAIRYSFSV